MVCPEKNVWHPIYPPDTECLRKIAQFALDQHYAETGEKLTLKEITDAWYKELDDDRSYYRFRIKATNENGEEGLYQTEVLEDYVDGPKRWSLIYFRPGVIVDGEFWLIVPDVEDPHIQQIAQFAVDTNNDITKDNLVYISTNRGYYQVVDENTKRYKLYLLAKDCLGRVREYEALVLEVKTDDGTELKYESFKALARKC